MLNKGNCRPDDIYDLILTRASARPCVCARERARVCDLTSQSIFIAHPLLRFMRASAEELLIWRGHWIRTRDLRSENGRSIGVWGGGA